MARRAQTGIDDALDAFAIHGIGGTIGALLTGLLANQAINPLGNNGLLHGNPSQLLTNGLGVVVAWALAILGTMVILGGLSHVMPLRAPLEGEALGLDITHHGEMAYGEDGRP